MQIQSTGSNIWSASKKTEHALKKTSLELKKILERLSTSNRINRAGDDAAGLAISEEFSSRLRSFKMASQNIEHSISAINIADSAGNEISGILQRQRELALQAGNSTLTESDRNALNNEYQQLTLEIDRISQSSNYNKQGVSAGEDLASGNAIIQAGADATDQITMPKIDLRAAVTGISGTTLSNTDNAIAALKSVDEAISAVNSQRSTLGSAVNRLESSINNLSVAIINTQAAESVIQDQDMAQGLTELSRLKLLQEGGLKAFARFKTINSNHILGIMGE